MIKRAGIKGFTIVELLIVIVVIAILAAIVITVYNGVQTRAQASALIDGFKKIDKAFHLMSVDQGITSWWADTDPVLYPTGTTTFGGNPQISAIVAAPETGMSKYLQRSPTVSGLSGHFTYDNDGDTYVPSACTNVARGVNVFFSSIPLNVAQAVDDSFDDGDLNCGNIRLNAGTQLFYGLSNTQSF